MNGEQSPQSPSAANEDQPRLELAMAAANAERANQPRGLIVIAIMLLLGTFIYAGFGWMARNATLQRVETDRAAARAILREAARVQVLTASQLTRGLVSDPRIGPEIEGLAQQHGVKADAAGKSLVVPETESTGLAVPGITQKKYNARVTGQDANNLLAWLVDVQTSEKTRGVEISQLMLRPDTVPPGATGGGNWSLDVEFVRWEKK